MNGPVSFFDHGSSSHLTTAAPPNTQQPSNLTSSAVMPCPFPIWFFPSALLPAVNASELKFVAGPGDTSMPDDDEDQERDRSASSPASPGATDSPGNPHRIVIVGGGAGGLELAARLGDDLGRRRKAEIILVDAVLTHLWKPLLHEVAAGTLGLQENELDFLQQARRHHFRFHLGRLETVDRARRQIWLAPLVNEEALEIAPRRPLAYDTLVIAIGAVENDFGTPGVRLYAHSLNNQEEAERFHRRLLALCARAELGSGKPVHVVIVGGGATGVELSAELTDAAEEIASYGMQLKKLRRPLHITLIEASPRLLGSLPKGFASRIHRDLLRRDIDIRLGQRVAEVDAGAVVLASGERIEAELVVWTAGVKGPAVLERLDGLKISRERQLLVYPTLQTSDDDIFAFGDCANCVPRPGGPAVPPTAQAASQQARLLARSLARRIAGKPLLKFSYRQRGSFVSLGHAQVAGSVVAPQGRRLMVGGLPARFSYWILYRRHLATLLGIPRTLLLILGQWLSRRSQPRVKLH